MRKKAFTLCIPLGLFIYLIYVIINRFFFEIPDIIAYIMMTLSIVLMLIGIAYQGYQIGKQKNSSASK